MKMHQKIAVLGFLMLAIGIVLFLAGSNLQPATQGTSVGVSGTMEIDQFPFPEAAVLVLAGIVFIGIAYVLEWWSRRSRMTRAGATSTVQSSP